MTDNNIDMDYLDETDLATIKKFVKGFSGPHNARDAMEELMIETVRLTMLTYQNTIENGGKIKL